MNHLQREATTRERAILRWMHDCGAILVPAREGTLYDLMGMGHRLTGVQPRIVSRMVDAAWVVAPPDGTPLYRITAAGRAVATDKRARHGRAA